MNAVSFFLCFSLAAANVLNSPIHSTSLVQSQANFTTRFFQEVIKSYGKHHNIVVSPLSVYMVLAMLRVGAAKRTKLQIDQTMALPNDEDVGMILSNFARLLFRENTTAVIRNKIWQQEGFCFTQCRTFTTDVEKKFHASLEEVNFMGNPKEAAYVINRWAYVASRGRITKLIDEANIESTTRFVLTNMIYFKANWENIFTGKATEKREFRCLNEGVIVSKYVDTMHINAKFRYTLGFDADYSLLELPYTNKNFAMIIILPRTVTDISEVEKSMNLTKLNFMINRLQSHPKTVVDVYIPKFCVSTGTSLNDVLKAMGLKDVFHPSVADLSKISGFKGMHVSSVRHEAFIKVTEHGTEAAGGTSSTTEYFSSRNDFRINRPFMFLIRHAPTNSVVFIGKILDPTIQSCRN